MSSVTPATTHNTEASDMDTASQKEQFVHKEDKDDENLEWDDDEFELTDIANTVDSQGDANVASIESSKFIFANKEASCDCNVKEQVEEEDDQWMSPVTGNRTTDVGRVVFSSDRIRNANRKSGSILSISKPNDKTKDGDVASNDPLRQLCCALSAKQIRGSKTSSILCGICHNPLESGETMFHARCMRAKELRDSGVATVKDTTARKKKR
jgi:hypothetical protein